MNILQYESLQERKSHVTEDFPYNTYLCTIPLDFTNVPIHWHEEMEIIYVKKGRGVISVDLGQSVVEAGTLALILPGRLHAICQYGDERMEYENIIFQVSLLYSRQTDVCARRFLDPMLSNPSCLPTFLTPDLPDYPALAGCLDQADEICKTFPEAYPFAIKSQLNQFFYLLFSRCGMDCRERTADPSLDRVKKTVKYIETNYAHQIRVADIAGELGMSASHFMKYFRETMGSSFVAYLNEYRLTMASRLLRTSTDSILTIASETGFESLSYFNRLFKARFGTTPRAYRRGAGA